MEKEAASNTLTTEAYATTASSLVFAKNAHSAQNEIKDSQVESAASTEVMLQIWDTPGQQRHRSVVRIYYRNLQAVVLVVSLEQSSQTGSVAAQLRNLQYYLRELLETCGEENLGFLLVGNKSDVATELEDCEH